MKYAIILMQIQQKITVVRFNNQNCIFLSMKLPNLNILLFLCVNNKNNIKKTKHQTLTFLYHLYMQPALYEC